MVSRNSPNKVTMGFRVQPKIKDLIFQVASSEGMDASEWIRKVVIDELKKRNLLPITMMLLEENKKPKKG
jgi:antitoxin component of RelBE/YafQ-DinJ toxin-antitoxin module